MWGVGSSREMSDISTNFRSNIFFATSAGRTAARFYDKDRLGSTEHEDGAFPFPTVADRAATATSARRLRPASPECHSVHT